MKRILKKGISVFLVVAMLFCAAPLGGLAGVDLSAFFGFNAEATTYGGTCGTNLNWTLDTSTGKLTISGTGDMYDWTISSNVPWYYYRSSIKTVTITDGVTSIGVQAFNGCSSLTSADIPYGVTSIDEGAFAECTALTSILIPDNVTNLGDYVFFGCDNLINIEIADSVITIGEGAFAECSALTSILIPDNVTNLGDYVFSGCDSLINIEIADSVTSIGEEAFSSCDSLKSIIVDYSNTAYSSDEYGVLFNKNKTELIFYPNGNTRKSYTVPAGVKSICNNAFYSCDNLRNITISDGVTSIGEDAFGYCSSLTNITIPDSVTSIGDGAFFDYLYGVKNVYYTGTESKWNEILIGERNEKLSDATIHFNCFEGKLTASGVCGENLTWEFYEPTGELVIRGTGDMTNWSNNSEVSWYAVRDDIRTVTIGDDVTSIGDYAFFWCESLTNIEIPENIMSINDAFGECDSLSCITVDSANTAYSSDEFGVLYNKDKTQLVQYPIGNIRTSYTISDGVTNIYAGSFYGCSNLTSVEIPNSITSIGEGTFYGCYSLTRIKIPDSVTSIDIYAFQDCTSLTDVYYIGTEEEWNDISFGSGNNALLNATIHFEHIHSYTFFVEKEVSCTDSGLMFFVCKCGDSYTEEVAKISHNESEWEVIIEATCTTHGKKTKKCTVCGTIIKNEIIPFANHSDCNSDGLCDICDKISNVELVKNIHISIATPEKRTINYMESIKLYATATNLPEGYKIKWKVEGEGVMIKPSSNGKTCTVTSTSTGNVVVKVYIVDSNGNIVTDKNGKQVLDSEFFYSEANLWLRIVYFFKKLFGISMTTAQVFKGIV